MRKIDVLLSEYGESHQDHTNKAIHWVCVPAIFWSVTALLWSIPQPEIMQSVAWLNWMTLAFAASILYYLTISRPLALGFVLVGLVCIGIIQLVVGAGISLWMTALVIFVIAWVGQFWGHKIEGKKPSFFKDVQFLLIGPAWLMSFIYKRIGINF